MQLLGGRSTWSATFTFHCRMLISTFSIFFLTIWLFNIAMENHIFFFLIGKPSINGPFPVAMLNNQRVKYILPYLSYHSWLVVSMVSSNFPGRDDDTSLAHWFSTVFFAGDEHSRGAMPVPSMVLSDVTNREDGTLFQAGSDTVNLAEV